MPTLWLGGAIQRTYHSAPGAEATACQSWCSFPRSVSSVMATA